ncbi:MAG TPA: carboxypeptidase-like regulatory domain-containing protein [Bryobacteraceae bacterium]|nr:carboxypeptidase-like regulatory domain-containing protein [Bryobacteraceae bacterium]
MKKAMLLLAALLSAPFSKLEACSVTDICPHHGFAAAKMFTVTVLHAGKPLKGVLVEVTPDGDGLDIAGTTEAAGAILFENLRPGNYHISVSMLGITTVYQRFHVAKWTTALTAKRTMTFNWGDDAPETRQIAGKLVSRRVLIDASGQHPDLASVPGIHLTLTDALTGMRFETTSTPEGLIGFSDIAEGVYVLHSDGDERRHYDPGDCSFA